MSLHKRMVCLSIVRIWLLNMALSLAVLLVEKIPEILGRKRDDIGRVLFDDSFGIVLENVREFVGDDYLFSAVDSLLSDVSHNET